MWKACEGVGIYARGLVGELGILWDLTKVSLIRGNLGSKMGLIRKCAKISFCELEFKNQ